MDTRGQHENERLKMDLYSGVHPPWNMMPQYQMKEANTFVMNKKIMQIIADKNAAIEELNRAVSNRNSAIQERNEAIKLRDEAITARNNAYRERESAIAALRFHESSINGKLGAIRSTKRKHHSNEYHVDESQITDVIPLSMVQFNDHVNPRQAKSNRKETKPKVKSPTERKRIEGDLNRQVSTDGSKAEWDAQDLGFVGIINFDENTMPVPVCTCTGVPRHCYKWGSGGWQSSCCTNLLSVFPLPQLQHKRHARMGGRKMSGSVFTRLLSRVAADGHDLSVPLDLKNYWAKHGTNRYITIK